VGNGGEESQCGWCKDKWGINWQITPIAMMKAFTGSDRAAAKRAFDAMMTMKKIDVAAIETAVRVVPGWQSHRRIRQAEAGHPADVLERRGL
jgi:hypothetical protein